MRVSPCYIFRGKHGNLHVKSRFEKLGYIFPKGVCGTQMGPPWPCSPVGRRARAGWRLVVPSAASGRGVKRYQTFSAAKLIAFELDRALVSARSIAMDSRPKLYENTRRC